MGNTLDTTAEALSIESPAGLKHDESCGEQGNSLGLGKCDRLVIGALAPDEDNTDKLQHFRCPDYLGIGGAGYEQSSFLGISQNVAQEVSSESVADWNI
jgi:hypothetical protein